MSKGINPYKDSPEGKKQQVRRMFDSISGNYDGMNRVISFGIDVKWRKKVVKAILDSGADEILDIATGTGDLAISIAKKSKAHKIIGVDISEGMLLVGRKKIAEKKLGERVKLMLADSEDLPFEGSSFGAASVAFGVRNFENLERGLSEIHRVLKPGGLFVVLETSVPTKTPFKQGYSFYCNRILPFIGKTFSKDENAYAYLSESASVFPHGENFNNILRKIGFTNVKDQPQTFGAATIYTAEKKA